MTADAGLLCPVCRVDLVMTERQNIEIDYCPKCRGVWLDRGELDKIIEKALLPRRSNPRLHGEEAGMHHLSIPIITAHRMDGKGP